MGRIDAASAAFTEIYSKDLWHLISDQWANTPPGFESLESRMKRLAHLIQEFIKNNNVQSVVDFGCGFSSYTKMVDWKGVEYDGFDIVKGVIDYNIHTCATDTFRFHHVVDGTRLPSADLLISKDVLQHLPTADVQYYLDIFKRNYKFAIIGNDVFPDDNTNGDTPPGGYRALRLDLPPFNWPCAVVQRWESVEFGVHTVKHFCLMMTSNAATATGAIIRNSSQRTLRSIVAAIFDRR
jgi:hypothetical protein